MKKLRIFMMSMLVLIAQAVFIACGGDGTDDGGNSEINGGVNVNKGKKLVKLKLIVDHYHDNTKYPWDIRISYDSQNRLSRIIAKNVTYKYIDWDTGELVEHAVGDFDIAQIDYNLRTISLYPSKDYCFQYQFMLNNKGYISQIGTCSCIYDSEGYLIGVDSPKEIWSLSYDNGDIIKSVVDNLSLDKTKIFFYYYGEDPDKGELVFTMRDPDLSGQAFEWTHEDKGLRSLLSFIAYQSGLFGKISKNCSALSKSKNQEALFKRVGDNKTKEVHCSFEYE
jgi:hypothetical protein